MRKQKGFGLLEILITLVLLGVGVAGLVALARNMLNAAQDGRRYEVAMRLAESKLDELRNFNGATHLASGASVTFYEDIVSGPVRTLSPSDGGGTYYLSWSVDNQYLTSGSWSTTNLDADPYPDRKLIVMTVNWSDSSSVPRTLQLAGAISPTGSLSSQEVAGLARPPQNPKIDYTKGSVPDVVAVALGDGNNKETSKPLPHIQGGSSTSRTVQFDTVTYQTVNNNASSRKAVQDSATVSCSCTFAGATAGSVEPAYLPSTPYYVQTDKVQYWKVGNTNPNKSVGALDGNANQQEQLCPTCCREHYDVSSSTKFSDYYNPLNIGRTMSRSNGIYVDACRFIRIDGTYRPAPDWHLASLTVFSSDFLNNSTNLANYQAYIAYVVTEYAKQQKTAFSGKSDDSWFTSTVTFPSTSSAPILSFNAWLAEKHPLDTTTLLTTPTSSNQLVSRGIYVDIMSPSYLQDEVFKTGDIPDLAKIPFQDINMTLLNDWSSSDVTIATISSETITTSNKTYSRGLLAPQKTTSQPITITASSYKGNSGVVGTLISPQDSPQLTASMAVSINNTLITEIHGPIQCLQLNSSGNGSAACDTAVINGISITSDMKNVSCKILNIGLPATPYYTCSGAPSSSFNLNLVLGGYTVIPNPPYSLQLPASGTLTGRCIVMLGNTLTTAYPATPTVCQ